MVASRQVMAVSTAAAAFGEAKNNWGWLLALGILFIALGIIGLGMAVSLTLASMLFFGLLLIIGGIFQLVEAFMVTGWKSVVWHVLIALVYIVIGSIIAYDPAGGAMALTLFIAISLIATGVLRFIMAFQLKGAQKWWWWSLMGGGIISIWLGVLIMTAWPSSAFWVIGLYIAIELFINGWAYLMTALAARQAAKTEQ